MSDELLSRIKWMERELERLRAFEVPTRHVLLTTMLQSTDWDGGDNFSTTAKTLIDLSVKFPGLPEGVKSVDVSVAVKDSGSAGTYCVFVLDSTNAANLGHSANPSAVSSRYAWSHFANLKCDANGDLYYQITASGAGTMNVIIYIWGYMK